MITTKFKDEVMSLAGNTLPTSHILFLQTKLLTNSFEDKSVEIPK
jgi:hypothetical protein